MKRFWDSNYGGQGYDAVARRKGAPTDTPATVAPIRSGGATSNLAIGSASASAGRAGGRTPVGGHRTGSAQGNSEVVLGLQAQVRDMNSHLEGLEKERDFYFAKVRCFCLKEERCLRKFDDDPYIHVRYFIISFGISKSLFNNN
jgi:RP/EB family microtubule-associated protein